ncbi:MAG: helix-turn-helix domain-containing protein [Alphaproteobacteria bacterium]|nr:helix-turn-helix domain-containing protein [Alphaproteobacteria bacterium]
MKKEEQYMSALEVAKKIGIHVATLHRWRKEGKFNIPHIKLPHKILYEREIVEAFLKSKTEGDLSAFNSQKTI